ncbi:MAG: 50S ribosomal protein L6 [Candidatus Spechtbacterales bacterium]
MSRIGKQPIKIPDNVEVALKDGHILVKGPKGELGLDIHPLIDVEKKDGVLLVKPNKPEKNSAALWGLTRALISNMFLGVISGYAKKLDIEGVGYKAQVQGKNLIMHIGFSHPVEFPIPENILITVEGNVIEVSGIDKGLVGQVSAKLRSLKKPEPYKGKGIRYRGEHIRRKTGKKAATV